MRDGEFTDSQGTQIRASRRKSWSAVSGWSVAERAKRIEAEKRPFIGQLFTFKRALLSRVYVCMDGEGLRSEP